MKITDFRNFILFFEKSGIYLRTNEKGDGESPLLLAIKHLTRP